MDTIAPARASALTTGRTRCASVSGSTGVKPGRVDSPPTSMMSAPSSSILRPWAMAASASRCSPPSLNESGVTFRTPMMRGRSNLSSYLPQRQTLESRAMRILSRTNNSFYCIQLPRFRCAKVSERGRGGGRRGHGYGHDRHERGCRRRRREPLELESPRDIAGPFSKAPAAEAANRTPAAGKSLLI